MTDPDFRALLDQVADEAEKHVSPYLSHEQAWGAFLDRISTALAQPAPEPPTDEALLLLAAKAAGYERIASANDDYLSIDAAELVAFARAVLARWGQGNA